MAEAVQGIRDLTTEGVQSILESSTRTVNAPC